MAGQPQIVVHGFPSYGHQQADKRRLFIAGKGLGNLFPAGSTNQVMLSVDGTNLAFTCYQPKVISPNLIYVDFKYKSGSRAGGYGGDTDNVTITITDSTGTSAYAVGDTQVAPDTDPSP
jgi:hypothetical protein